ncbi:fatty acid desaturase [Pseudahrensia aquimaris]|uniref:Fatty acid desaturase n=1 Tax=Pseudahrensia aquimaris TaxID=744461 RepID=A0ABW3FHB8_9HYPH
MTDRIFDQRSLIASLDDAARQDLQSRNDRAGLIRLAAHVLLLAASGTWIMASWPLWQGMLFLHGVMLVFLFTAQHEATHGTAFASEWLNTWVARVAGVVLIVPPLWFRYFHFAHHRHTQDPDNDPELEGGKPETLAQYVFHVSGLPLWWAMIKVTLGNATNRTMSAYVPEKATGRIRLEARVMLTLYASLALASFFVSSTALLWLWVIPAILGQPVLRLYLLAEHGRCPMVANMLENSRTTLTNSAIRFIAWNMPYHAEHHAMPTVPFHKLPKLHEIAQSHLGSVSQGYGEFHKDYVDGLKTAKR